MNKSVNIKTSGGYTLEQIRNNKNCSKDMSFWYNIEGTDRYLFKSKAAMSWEFYDPLIENPIRNCNQIYIKFLDVSKFVEPSNYFREHGCYTHEIEDTISGEAFWDDLENKILNGFEWEGIRITGRHFFTINFGRFRAIPVDEEGNAIRDSKVWTFLRFLDHQYYAFHEFDECLLNGVFGNKEKYLKWFPDKTEEDFSNLKMENFVLAKSRRKGWSAVEGIGIVTYNFLFQESSMNIIASYEKAHYKPILGAIRSTKNFTDKYTPWIRVTDIKGTATHFISGIKTVDDYGIKTEEGYLSEVMAMSFQDNPFKAIGDSADTLIVEEPGKFDTLLDTYPVSIEPLIRDGENRIGVCIMGGSAGDMEGGGSVALSKIIYNPSKWGFKSYDNIYEDKDYDGRSGWFIDDLWYLPFRINKKEILTIDSSDRTKLLLDNIKGNYVETVDEHGNSYRYFANLILERKRKENKDTDIKAYNKFITQQPKYLSEAFLLNESSPFDTATAQLALGDLRIHYDKIPIEKGSFGIDENGKPNWILNFSLQHIDRFPFDTSSANSDGCWVIYQRPIKDVNGSSTWRYVSGVDPIDMGRDESADSKRHSLACAYIIDVVTRNIVAEYVGRPSTAEKYWEQLWRGIEYYSARLLYENNLKGLKGHFEKRHKTYLLADEPESLRNTVGYKMNKNSIKGFHGTASINAQARKYIDSWTKEEMYIGQDTEGNNLFIPRMYSIKSIGLLEEILAWNSKGNFDRISGLGAAMLLLFDRLYEIQEDESTIDMFNEGIFKKMNKQLKTKNRFNTKEYATK